MVQMHRTAGKLAVKDDRVRALENERLEVEQKIETQHQEFAQRMELLKGDHEKLQKAVSRGFACIRLISH